MPVESSVNNQLCQSCHADVRPGSQFCYSCGSAVASDFKNGNESQKNDASKPVQTITKPDAQIGNSTGKPTADLSSAANKNFGAKNEKSENKNLIVEREEVLLTAASVRKQAKPAPKKNVQVVWEQPQNSVNILFVIATLILIILAAGALMAMLYLR